MFSQHLFTHKYDIDDVILALCAAQSSWIETQTGHVTLQAPANVPAKHVFEIQPLPQSFVHEISTHAEVARLNTAEQAELQQLLGTLSVQALPDQYRASQTRIGGWLRERLKEAALEWLDANDLIPPSMKHINRKPAPLAAGSKTVKISTAE